MRNLNRIVVLMFLTLLLTCDDILEEDIRNVTVETFAPVNNAIIEGNVVQFSWNRIDGADNYRLQILTSDQRIVLDSLVPALTIDIPLEEGEYQWRLRAENFAYTSPYAFPTNFTLSASQDLSNQMVILRSPEDNVYRNVPITTFSWNAISTANDYSFELVRRNDSGESVIFGPETLTDISINVEDAIVDEDAEYIWRVMAFNRTSNTNTEITEYSFFIDTEIPNLPVLIAPEDMVSIQQSVQTFEWSNSEDTGNVMSPVTLIFEISKDSNFEVLEETLMTTSESVEYEFTEEGTYYWRVRVRDAAGNENGNSVSRTLNIIN